MPLAIRLKDNLVVSAYQEPTPFAIKVNGMTTEGKPGDYWVNTQEAPEGQLSICKKGDWEKLYRWADHSPEDADLIRVKYKALGGG